jgi:two-component system, chemotaxis family, response regulator Rcp1
VLANATKRLPSVLLVEDNAGDALLIEEAFQELGHLVQISNAKDGEQAIEYLAEQLRRNAPLPNLILLDLNMPKLTGHEVLRQLSLNQDLSEIPVIVLTSSNAPTDVVNAYANRCNAYIRKPSDFDGYIALIQSVTSMWLK